MTCALYPGLEDPKLWEQLATVASIYSRGRAWLRDELESACNLAVAKACRDWRPDRGMAFRSYATLVAHRECQNAIESDRPRGFRGKGRKGPAVVSLEGMAKAGAGPAADLAADPSPGPSDLAELRDLAAVAAGSLGPDAPVVLRWAGGESSAELAADLGVSRQRVHQKIDRGIGRARGAMAGPTARFLAPGGLRPPARPARAAPAPPAS